MRRKYLFGNWKMFRGPTDARALAATLREVFAAPRPYVVAVFPPAVSIPAVVDALEGGYIEVGAQNMHWLKEGAMTGEVAGDFFRDAGCSYALVGHSERRQFFGETDATANKRVSAAFAAGLRPVLCVGETLAERDANETEQVVERQLRGGLHGLLEQEMKSVVIAYEPVWAIGTGRVATPEQAQAVHAYIRNLLRAMAPNHAEDMAIVYGGSVKPDNADGLLEQPDIDGALVGGASLDAAGFAKIGDSFPR